MRETKQGKKSWQKFARVILFLGSFSLGQLSFGSTVEQQERYLANQIKSEIEEALQERFKESDYIIGVNINLEQKEEQSSQVLPMPGLPTLPGHTTAILIKNLEITLLLKKGEFKEEERAFIKKVVTLKSGFDESRGDKLNIEEITFPQKETTQVFKEESLISPYRLTGLAILFLGGILLLWFFRGRNNQKLMTPVKTNEELRMYPLTPVTSSVEPEKELWDELRQLMVVTVVGNPSHAARILKRWIISDKEKGSHEVALFLRATDPKLINTMQGELDPELVREIKIKVDTVNLIDRESTEKIFKRFREEFQAEYHEELTKYGEGHEKDLFLFLRELEPHQILEILQDEPPGVIAVALAQLQPEVAARVLLELPQDKRFKAPVEMGHLKNVPASGFYEIADRLSRKALNVSKIKYVTTDGKETLLGIINELEQDKELEILNNIKYQDLELSTELRKVYLSFPEFKELPDSFLGEFLRPLDRDLIAKSLVGTPEELKNKILHNLPPKVRTMVEDTLKMEIPPEEVNIAQKTIARALREFVKSKKIDLVKILSKEKTG